MSAKKFSDRKASIKDIVAIISGLIRGFYKIEKCPKCGHLYLGEHDICSWCGYDAFYDRFE